MPYIPRTPELKMRFRKLGHACNRLAALLTALAAYTQSVAAGVAAGAFWLLGEEASEVAEDPARRSYAEKVRVITSGVRVPRPTQDELRALAKASEFAFKAVPYVSALSVALERYQGASRAGNLRYQRTHARTIRELVRRIWQLIRSVRSFLSSGARKISKTRFDLVLGPEEWMDSKKKVRQAYFASAIRTGLVKATKVERKDIARYERWVRRLDVKKLPRGELSDLLNDIYRLLGDVERALKQLA